MTTNEYTGTNTYNKHLTLEQRISIASLIESNRNQDGSLKIMLIEIATSVIFLNHVLIFSQ